MKLAEIFLFLHNIKSAAKLSGEKENFSKRRTDRI